ncbi:hypothetical protein G9A89_005808 [Geosiphon pyriformis]|nr:hypothetical protein G9A89_005808 [Geosiphon pyriformis]
MASPQVWNLVLQLFILFLVQFLPESVEAAKVIRNRQNQNCMQRTQTSSTNAGCFELSTTNCPVDRSDSISDSLQWNIIPGDLSLSLSNVTDVFIKSVDNKLCLASEVSDTAQVCPCDSEQKAQKWKLSGDNLMNGRKCLGMVGNNIGMDSCQLKAFPFQWKIYHTASYAINVYTETAFTQRPTTLSIGSYTQKTLPPAIFSSAFSLEIPPGFQFVISRGKKNLNSYDSDMAQTDPIGDLTATIEVKIKPGIVVYEQAAYFGQSQFFENGNSSSAVDPSNPWLIGSVMIPDGFRGIMWSSTNFSGENFALYEPIANFTGVTVGTSQAEAGSIEISSVKIPVFVSLVLPENYVTSVCRDFGGQLVKDALQVVMTRSISLVTMAYTEQDYVKNNAKKVFSGTNATSVHLVSMALIANLVIAVMGSAILEENALVTRGGKALLIKIHVPFPNWDILGQMMACSPGCLSCSQDRCTQCDEGLLASTDTPTMCILKVDRNNKTCDRACEKCYGDGPDKCFKCAGPKYLMEGKCVDTLVQPNNGQCLNESNGFYIADNVSGVCQDCSYSTFSTTTPIEKRICTKCTPGFKLDGNNCVLDCPSGKYFDQKKQTCEACNEACASCSGPSRKQCLSCPNEAKPAQFAFNGICSNNECPSSYVSINTTCTKCHPDCAECTGPNLNQCTKCPSNRPIMNKDHQCIEVCPMGTYVDSVGNCQPCNKDCSSCVGPEEYQCLGCVNTSKVLVGGSCSGTCPSGTVINTSEGLCQKKVTNNVVAPIVEKSNKEIRKLLPWWIILLITVTTLFMIIGLLFLLRYCAVKRRMKKTEKFKEQIDENTVANNMTDLYTQAELNGEVSISRPEMSHRPVARPSIRRHELSTIRESTPPEYRPEDEERYWGGLNKKNSFKSKIDRRKHGKDDWEGFEAVVLNEGEGSSGPTKRQSNSSNRSSNWGTNWI